MIKSSQTVNKLQKIFDNSLEGVVIANMLEEDEPITYCNAMFTSMTGYERHEVIGKNCRFLQGKERNQPGLLILRSAINSNQPCKVVLKNYKKNGDLFYNRLSIFPVKNDMGVVSHYIGIQDDITDIIETKDKFLDMLEEKQVLLAEVHHRVKNNLAVISALLDIESYNENNEHSLQKSKLRINSMASIHENIYKEEGFSKIKIDTQIRHLIEIVKSQQTGNTADINFKLNISELALNLNQAIPFTIGLSELIDNIFKHAFSKNDIGTAYITLKNIGDEIYLEISDSGRGLPSDFTLENNSGTGLIIATQTFSQIDADFNFKNKKNRGAYFTIRFERNNLAGSSQSIPVK